jgi:medium-chain acyl-[acyl-carrier-protein] hydrolase
MNSPWFQTFKAPVTMTPDPNPIKLYTFHHAGGSCQYFQPWVAKLPPWIELISIQLPGRWNRAREEAFLHIEQLTPILGAEFKNLLAENPQQTYAFYGHSLGGLVAYDLTKYLTTENLPLPVHLFISSKRSVQNPSHKFPIYELPMDKFEIMIAELYGALPTEITADPDMKEVFLSITKKDMELLDTYIYTPEPLINVPLTILGGIDDHVITLDTLQGWKELTSASCEILQLPGDHFFLRTSEAILLEKIVNTLKSYRDNNYER